VRHTRGLCACPAATDDAHMLGWPFRVLCLAERGRRGVDAQRCLARRLPVHFLMPSCGGWCPLVAECHWVLECSQILEGQIHRKITRSPIEIQAVPRQPTRCAKVNVRQKSKLLHVHFVELCFVITMPRVPGVLANFHRCDSTEQVNSGAASMLRSLDGVHTDALLTLLLCARHQAIHTPLLPS
jgi:hypothetical protein